MYSVWHDDGLLRLASNTWSFRCTGTQEKSPVVTRAMQCRYSFGVAQGAVDAQSRARIQIGTLGKPVFERVPRISRISSKQLTCHIMSDTDLSPDTSPGWPHTTFESRPCLMCPPDSQEEHDITRYFPLQCKKLSGFWEAAGHVVPIVINGTEFTRGP